MRAPQLTKTKARTAWWTITLFTQIGFTAGETCAGGASRHAHPWLDWEQVYANWVLQVI